IHLIIEEILRIENYIEDLFHSKVRLYVLFGFMLSIFLTFALVYYLPSPDDPFLIKQAYAFNPINVNVRITSFHQITNPDSLFYDYCYYYAVIAIGSNSINGRDHYIQSASFTPPSTNFWNFGAPIDRDVSGSNVPIIIDIFDRDDGSVADEPININAQNPGGHVGVMLHLDAGTVTGEVIQQGQANVGVGGGRFTSEGPDAIIGFEISYDPASTIQVTKSVTNDDGGHKSAADFRINIQGRNVWINPP